MAGNEEFDANRGRQIRPVDLVHLARQTLGDRDLESEVLQLFATQARHVINQMRRCDTPAQIADLAHAIKGAALGVGAFPVANAAGAVWTAARHGSDSERGVAMDDLEQELATAIAFVASMEAPARAA